jgi:hypothetical protein
MTEALGNKVGRATETLSPETVQQDLALEYDSMVFLSAIEQLAVRLSGHMMPTSPALALASLVDLANRIVAFVEQLPMARARKFSLEALVARDLPNYTQLGLQHVREHRFSREALERTMRSGDILHPISTDILRVLNTCLAINVKAFHSSEMRQQWKTIYAGFLVHVAKTLQKCDPAQRT